MKTGIREFRREHDCRNCLYYMNLCKAWQYCVYDFLPEDALEEDVELFIVGG